MKELTSYDIPNIEDLPKIEQPYGYRLIISPLKPREVTKGGIILSTQSQQDENLAQQFGVIVSLGDMAFKSKETGEYVVNNAPKVGDIVMYFRFAGQGRNFIKETVGEDGNIESHRMIFLNDADIAMKIDNVDGYRLR